MSLVNAGNKSGRAIKGLRLYYHLNSYKDGLFSSKKMIESKPL